MSDMPNENIFLPSEEETIRYATRWASKERRERAREIVENPDHPLHAQYLELMSAIVYVENLIIHSMDDGVPPLDRQATAVAAISLIARNV